MVALDVHPVDVQVRPQSVQGLRGQSAVGNDVGAQAYLAGQGRGIQDVL
jgi:hypothetical protein